MKNIYGSFNNIEIDLNEYEEVKINDNEVNEIKSRLLGKLDKEKRNYKKHKTVAAAMAGIITVTAMFNSNIVSASIDKLTRTIKTYFIENVHRDFSDYTIPVGKTITDNDISVTLNEFIIDNNLIIVNYTIDYSKSKNHTNLNKYNIDSYLNYYINININGNKITDGGGSPTIISQGVINNVAVYTLDDLKVEAPLEINIGYEFYNEKLVQETEDENLSQVIEEEKLAEVTEEEDENLVDKKGPYYECIPIEGNWSYKFNISDEEIDKSLKAVKLTENNIVEMYGKEIRITEIIKSDLTLKINYEWLDENRLGSVAGEGLGEGTRIDDPIRSKYGVYDENGDGFKMYVFTSRNNKGSINYFINDPELNKYIIENPKQEIIVDFSE